jgi:hypothetical protein
MLEPWQDSSIQVGIEPVYLEICSWPFTSELEERV